MSATTDPPARLTEIQAWENDPGTPAAPYAPISRPRPALDADPLPLAIYEREPAGDDEPGSPAFRYWAGAEALRRASDHWGAVIGSGAKWRFTNRRELIVRLDAGVDLNAYYDRDGLHFFHAPVGEAVVYAGESPDVVCHEHGHAVLDALRPELFDAPFAEAAAFHEAFGDVSALLAALALSSVREALIAATGGRIHRSSSVSRLAEQLGWAVRLRAPEAVERDALRNLATTWFYRDPAALPPTAPASQLSSEPHSFSRVFSGAFLRVLSGMLLSRGEPADAEQLALVAADAAELLRDAVATSPVVPAYFSQLAAHMLAADETTFGGRYRAPLTSAFVRHGILSVPAAAALASDGALSRGRPRPSSAIDHVTLPGSAFGLLGEIVVHTPVERPRFAVAGATHDLGSAAAPTPARAVASFVEDLVRRGRVDLTSASEEQGSDTALQDPVTGERKSHGLVVVGERLLLRRRFFDCGLCGA